MVVNEKFRANIFPGQRTYVQLVFGSYISKSMKAENQFAEQIFRECTPKEKQFERRQSEARSKCDKILNF